MKPADRMSLRAQMENAFSKNGFAIKMTIAVMVQTKKIVLPSVVLLTNSCAPLNIASIQDGDAMVILTAQMAATKR